ncbi:hypothetical protein Tco_0317617 [Tanacetum coccineum]
MHKEAQQAAGGPTSLGATSEEGAHPQLSSGANEESKANDISLKVKLGDLSNILKDTRSAFFTPDSLLDEPISVSDESREEEEVVKDKDTESTSYDFKKSSTLDSLPSLLHKVTDTLNRFATTVANASGATSMNVPSVGKTTASPAKGEKNTKDELDDLLGKNVMTQYYTKKLLFDKYCDKMLKQMKSPKIINCKVLTNKGHITLNIYREDGSDEVISNLKNEDDGYYVDDNDSRSMKTTQSLDEGLYALVCEEDVRCLATLVRIFKLIEVYIEHSVTPLDSYLRAPWFKATLEEINDEPASSIAANRTEKMLLLTWHECSETPKEPVCDSVTPSSLSQVDCILTPTADESVIIYTQLSGVQGVDTQSHVIDDVIRQLSFDETELDEEAGFVDVAGSGVDRTRCFRTQEPILVDVSIQEPIVAEVSTQEPIVVEVSTKLPIVEEVGTHDFTRSDGLFFFDDEGIDTEYDVHSSEDASTDDDDDVDEDFLVDEENEIVEPTIDVHLFGNSMDLPFDNIGVTNLVSDDVLEGEDVDVINPDGFNSDHGNDEDTNYKKRRLAELRTEMEGVINASGQWKYSFYTGHKFSTPKEAKDRVYLHSIESRRNLKLYKNDGVRITARCDGNMHVFTMSHGDGPTGPNRGMKPRPSGSSGSTTRSKKGIIQISMSKAFRAKAKAKREIRGDHILQYYMLRDYVVKLLSTNPNTTVKIVVERNTDPSLPTRVFQRIYVCLGALKLGFRAYRRDLLGLNGASMKGPFLGQVLVVVGLDSNDGIYSLAYALVEAEIREKFDLLLNNIYKGFNSKIVRGRDKPVITLLEYIKEYCMKRIVNVQGVIDKCTSPLTPTATRIIESIKKEAHLMKEIGIDRDSLNTGHNKATCKGQGQKATTGGNNAEASSSAFRQAQQTKPAAGQDGSGGSGVVVVIGLSTAAGEGGQGGAGVASQVPMSETRNADGREIGDGVPTQSSAAGRHRFIMNDPNITMEEYIRLKEEKAQRQGQTFDWQTAMYGKTEYYENEDNSFMNLKT